MPSLSILYFDFFTSRQDRFTKLRLTEPLTPFLYSRRNFLSFLLMIHLTNHSDTLSELDLSSRRIPITFRKRTNSLSRMSDVERQERGDRVKNQTGPAGSRVRESIVATIMPFPCFYRGNNERVNFSSLSGCPSLRTIRRTPQSVFPVPSGIFFASLLSLVIGWLLMAHDCLSTLVYDVFAILSYTSRCHFIFTDRSWDGRLFHEEISIGKTTFNRDLSIREVGF